MEVPELPRSKSEDGGAQAMYSNPVDTHVPSFRPVDRHPHVPKRPQGRQAILALQESGDLGHSVGDCAQHSGPVRDRFVPGHADAAAKTATRRHMES